MAARRGQGQLAATTTTLELAARLAVFDPGVMQIPSRQSSVVTRFRLRVPGQYARQTKPVFKWVKRAELARRARAAVLEARRLSRACLVDFSHGVRDRCHGREEERDGADNRFHLGRPARNSLAEAGFISDWCLVKLCRFHPPSRRRAPARRRRHLEGRGDEATAARTLKLCVWCWL